MNRILTGSHTGQLCYCFSCVENLVTVKLWDTVTFFQRKEQAEVGTLSNSFMEQGLNQTYRGR